MCEGNVWVGGQVQVKLGQVSLPNENEKWNEAEAVKNKKKKKKKTKYIFAKKKDRLMRN